MSEDKQSNGAKIYIGTPCYGGQCFAGYVASLLQTQTHLKSLNPPVSFETCFLTNESLITRGRNTIVAKFLNDKSFTHLLFIDADISWHPATVEKLLKANVDIVGAIYPKKGYTWSNLSKVLPNMISSNEAGKVEFKDINDKMEAYIKANLMSYTMNYSTNRQVKNNLLEVKHIGTGFMMIKREVLERMCAKFTECKYDDDINILDENENKHLYSLFDCDISMGSDNKLHYLSEDYLFCKRWIDMGGQIFAEVTSPLTHTGTHSFQGHYLASLRFESENGGSTSVLDSNLVRQTTPADSSSLTSELKTQSSIPLQSQNQSTPPNQSKTQSQPQPQPQPQQQQKERKGIEMLKPLKPKDVSQIKLL